MLGSSEIHLIPRRKDNWCVTALFHNFVFPRMGDMLGISLFHLLNETYLLPRIMYLFSSTSRPNCLLEWSFQQLLERKFANRYKGNSLSFHEPTCWGRMKWCGYAAAMKGMLTPTVPVPAQESCLLFSMITARALCVAMFTNLMLLWEASITQRRGLIKTECHSDLITIVRGTVSLVSSCRNRFPKTTCVYIRNGSIFRLCYGSTPSLTYSTFHICSNPIRRESHLAEWGPEIFLRFLRNDWGVGVAIDPCLESLLYFSATQLIRILVNCEEALPILDTLLCLFASRWVKRIKPSDKGITEVRLKLYGSLQIMAFDIQDVGMLP